MIKSFYYLPDEGVKVIDGIADFDKLSSVEQSVLWVDMSKPTDEESFVLTHDFKFHPLAIEDVISEKSRTKIDDYNRYLFLVFPTVDFVGREEGMKVSELNLFLGEKTLVTVRHDDHRIFDYLYSRAERDERLLSRGADYLFHAIIDTVVDNYNSALDVFEYEVDQVEEDVLGEHDEETLKSIFTLRRDIVHLKRVVMPQKEVVGQLSRWNYQLVSKELRVYFSDIHDHLVRINETADTHKEILNSSLEIYFSTISTRTNEIIKVLTILTAIFIPPTFLVGLWGMNFVNMPELGLEHGYLISLIAIVLVVTGMILFFRRKKWI
jgi:magnesium transporter